jgi:hypothetical protein
VNVLIVADAYPDPDRNAADPFSVLLGMIAEHHGVFYCAIAERQQIEAIGNADAKRYRDGLAGRGVRIVEGGVKNALRARQYAAVVFEWYFAARDLLDEVRVAQPGARIIIDTVDVVFNRLEAKARVTNASEDVAKAAATKAAELTVYNRSDIVITVTDADAAILHGENPRIATFTIPTIHAIQDPVAIPTKHDKQLIFIGSFVRPGRNQCRRDGLLLRGHFAAHRRRRTRRQAADHRQFAEPRDRRARVRPRRGAGLRAGDQALLEASVVSIAPLRFGGGIEERSEKLCRSTARGDHLGQREASASSPGPTPGRRHAQGVRRRRDPIAA